MGDGAEPEWPLAQDVAAVRAGQIAPATPASFDCGPSWLPAEQPARRRAAPRRPPARASGIPRAALHEAGHAIVAHAMGWRLTRARLGACVAALRCADERDGEVETLDHGLDPSKRLDRLEILACMLCGLEAERRQSRRSVLWLCAFGGAGGDDNAAVALVAAARRRPRRRHAQARRWVGCEPDHELEPHHHPLSFAPA